MSFVLDPQLTKDSHFVCELALCRVLLADDSQFPWLILVPRVPKATELYQLTVAQQHQFLTESARVCEALQTLFTPDKLNVAALGNVVSQLHIHHVARFTHDIAWPAPIWGRQPAVAYSPEAAQDSIARIKPLLLKE
ncbi:HIT domain-containing protein [Salinimonas marina]|uniref:HIT domain-containing protein n=1 Tax=Salinimonas marina TaxID=2785918 RepID=A0A7S9HBZ7_9ALTE|nr:HIT domain-containing protein [Salinimonas marina]QPG04625.1 HIT domain-containing protein [Salinimonas marina]